MGTRTVLTVLCTVLPVAVLLRYFYMRDAHREPRSVLVKTFLLGLLATIPVVLLDLGLEALRPASLSLLRGALYEAFVLAAIPEELLKLAVILRYSMRQASFEEPMDGIVYGATAALGFAFLENALYVAQGGLVVAALRSVTAVPMHAAAGAILGHFAARARFARGGRLETWKGLAAVVTLHGLYDFAALGAAGLATGIPSGAPARTGEVLGLIALWLATLATSIVWTIRLVRRTRREQLSLVPSASTTPSREVAPGELADASRKIPPSPSEGSRETEGKDRAA
jgi:RsiW-degrading membrane proteinase PrsW (M82 family)